MIFESMGHGTQMMSLITPSQAQRWKHLSHSPLCRVLLMWDLIELLTNTCTLDSSPPPLPPCTEPIALPRPAEHVRGHAVTHGVGTPSHMGSALPPFPIHIGTDRLTSDTQDTCFHKPQSIHVQHGNCPRGASVIAHPPYFS